MTASDTRNDPTDLRTAYHLIDVPGIGQIRVPLGYTAQDVLRDIASTDVQDAPEHREREG